MYCTSTGYFKVQNLVSKVVCLDAHELLLGQRDWDLYGKVSVGFSVPGGFRLPGGPIISTATWWGLTTRSC